MRRQLGLGRVLPPLPVVSSFGRLLSAIVRLGGQPSEDVFEETLKVGQALDEDDSWTAGQTPRREDEGKDTERGDEETIGHYDKKTGRTVNTDPIEKTWS